MNTYKAVIGKVFDGSRLDACLSQISGLTRSRCSRLIESGHVLLDEQIPKNKTKVREGDVYKRQVCILFGGLCV